MRCLSLSILSLMLMSSNIRAQTFTVSGTVIDASTHDPVVFASVLVQGTNTGTVTNDNGRFAVTLSRGDYRIRFSYVGYRALVESVSVKRDIRLSVSLTSLDILLQNTTVYARPEKGEGEQQEVSTLSLQSGMIQKVTALDADVLRSVEMLPGVSNDNEMSAKFNVHGGDFNENLVLVNGTQVYEPYHIKEASNASIGIFDADMIKRVDLITGGFSARYGDKMSSVLNIVYREGNRNNIDGQASLSMTDAGALLEGPIGRKGSFIIGARQSYTQMAMKMLNISPDLHISYYDVQGVLAYRLAPQHKLSLLFIHAGDGFSQDPLTSYGNSYTSPYYTVNKKYQGSMTQAWHDTSEQHADYYSSLVALKSKDVISSKAVLKSEISFYDQLESEHHLNQHQYAFLFDSNELPQNIFYRDTTASYYDNSLRIKTLELNSSYDTQVLPFYSILAGASYQRIFYYQNQISRLTIWELTNNGPQYPDTVSNSRNQNTIDNEFGSIDAQSFKTAGFMENIIQAGKRTIINIGGRFDYFDIDKELTWSPRFNIAFKISPEVTLRGAWGVYYQSPIYQQLAYSTASDTNTQSQKAIHYVAGMDYDIFSDEPDHNLMKLKIEAFDKNYTNLISSVVSSSGRIYYSRKNDAVGNASGIDVYLIYSTSWFSGWVSYSYLKAEQKLTAIDTTNYYFPRNTDQRNTLAAVGDFNLGKKWDLVVRIVYGSGYPYSPEVAVFDSSLNTWRWQQGGPNSAYLPAYKRVDARVSKDFILFGMPSSAFIDVSNILNFKNVQAYYYTFDRKGEPQKVAETLMPILPTFGMTVKF